MGNNQLVSIYPVKYIKQFYIKLRSASAEKMTVQVYLPQMMKLFLRRKLQ